MKQLFTKGILFISCLFTAVLINSGCNKTTVYTIPTLITTSVVTDASGTTGQSGGIVTGLDAVLRLYGVCYSSTNQLPTIQDSTSSDTIAQPAFAVKLKNLKPGTTYYLRAFAINAGGTGYGNVIQFTTGNAATSITGTVSTPAGSAAYGFADGTGANALFDNVQGITTGADGNFYIADSFNSAIRKLTPAGEVNTISGSGSIGYVDGAVADARFYAPQSLVTDAAGNIYVADFGNNVIRKITPDGTVSTLAGSGFAGNLDGTGTKAEFNSPRGIAIDAAGNLFVADRGNNLIRKITPAGEVTTVVGDGYAGYLDGPSAIEAELNKPCGLAFDAAGNLYIADAGNSAIRKMSTDGIISTFTGGLIDLAKLGDPQAITFDTKGNLFVADKNGRILEITKAGVLYTIAGNTGVTGFADGTGIAAAFASPQGISTDAAGNVWVADCLNNRIRKIVLP